MIQIYVYNSLILNFILHFMALETHSLSFGFSNEVSICMYRNEPMDRCEGRDTCDSPLSSHHYWSFSRFSFLLLEIL